MKKVIPSTAKTAPLPGCTLRLSGASCPKAQKGISQSERVALLTVACISLVFAADDMKAFPPPEPGMARHVIRLPKQKDEAAFKVELIIGKTVERTRRTVTSSAGCLRPRTFRGGVSIVTYFVS